MAGLVLACRVRGGNCDQHDSRICSCPVASQHHAVFSNSSRTIGDFGRAAVDTTPGLRAVGRRSGQPAHGWQLQYRPQM